MLTEELALYVLRNYAHLMNEEEQNSLKASASVFYEGNESNMAARVAESIFHRHQPEIFINSCPVCGGLARTIYAHQCKKGHRW